MKTSFVVGVCCALALVCAARAFAQTEIPDSREGSEMSAQYKGRVRAPELTGGRGWLNTDKPLSLAAFKGKVVLLDFWTYGCINCLHVFPDLKKLEVKYANNLVVIGVHSAKFTNERETDNIRRIILRYGLEHPVVNDADFAIWNAYAVRAWPTQILIDPAGYVIGKAEGEGNYNILDETIARTIEEFRRRGELNEQPLKLALERAKVGELPLAFPGKVLADAKSDRLFIADTNHDRIVVARLDGTLVDVIGTGARGAADGAFDKATFYRPQGLALASDGVLYVADTENHLIRRVDLKTRTVSTIAGTGEQSRISETKTGPARQTALSSPWDLQLVGRALYVAMAGTHQIWRLDLDREQIGVFAGSGREGRLDGALLNAAFAQPSGLASDGHTLYVADSESNVIRAISLADASSGESSAMEVRTLAGGDLFDFGDVDGTGDDVRLQHPLGVAFNDGTLFIADTYNHKIKQLDAATRAVKTYAGTGQPGQSDDATAAFYEPGGLSLAGGKLYVADTDNNAVRVIDLKTKRAATLSIKGLRPPEMRATGATEAETTPNAEEFNLEPQRLRQGAGDNRLFINVELPAGYHLNQAAPQRLQITVQKGTEHLALEGADPTSARLTKDLQLPLRLPLRALSAGAAELRIQSTLYYCREDNTGTCRIKTLIWRAPVEVTADAAAPHEIKAQGAVK